MTQREFVDAVSRHLKGLTDDEKRDILADYEEHFALGKEAGKSEQEIAAKLGEPKSLARQYRAGTMVRRAEEKHSVANVLNVVIAALALGMFNLIIALPLFLAALGVLVGFLAASVGIALGGFGAVVLSVASVFVTYWAVPDIYVGIGFFTGIGLTALGVLMCIGCFYIVKYAGIGLVKYVKFNINIASGERKQEEE